MCSSTAVEPAAWGVDQACKAAKRLFRPARSVGQLLPALGHIPAATCSHYRLENDNRPAFPLVSLGVEPPAESNRRPHPYHGTTRNRCANRRSPRSRPTVEAEVIGSLPTQVCVQFIVVSLGIDQSENP